MMKTSKAESSSHPTCPTTRQNYYFGKLLTAYDLQSEQRYLNEKRWLINRYGIGWGVVCGLNVTKDLNHPCAVHIEPGIALDQYGNEIVVCEPQAANIQTAHAQRDAASGSQGSGVIPYYITIKYYECAIKPSPIPVGTCDGYETDCAYDRTLETFKIDVTQVAPEKPTSRREELQTLIPCEADCLTFLNAPGHAVNQSCAPRQKCQPITLACVEFDTEANQILSIDTLTYRKLAFSNEMLYSLMQCMLGEIWQAKGAHHDRRRYVPLLANTIKGLTYQDGKIAELRNNVGADPFRLTTDGDLIWVTDRQENALIRIDRQTNASQRDVNLGAPSWGIAFDGKSMWITHHTTGQLSRISTCDLADRSTRRFDELPQCYPAGASVTSPSHSLPPWPQELVYHQYHLFVSHGWDMAGSERAENPIPHLAIIDTRRGCLLTTVPIDTPNYLQPVSPILAMATDGSVLWIVYLAESKREGDPEGPHAVLRKVQYTPAENGREGVCEIGPPLWPRDVTEPGKLAFDGTHLWLTHEHGASKIDIETGNEILRTNRMSKQISLAYGGGEFIWSAELGAAEARLNRINIYTAQIDGEVEFINFSEASNQRYEVNDVQFDGAFYYVVGRRSDNHTSTQGIIHRILP